MSRLNRNRTAFILPQKSFLFENQNIQFKGERSQKSDILLGCLGAGAFMLGSILMMAEYKNHKEPIPASAYCWLIGSTVGIAAEALKLLKLRNKDEKKT